MVAMNKAELARQIVAHYKVGKISQTSIGKRFGLSQASVCGILRAHGIKSVVKRRPAANRRMVSVTDNEVWEPFRVAMPLNVGMVPFSELYRGRPARGLFGRYKDVVYRRASL